MSGCPLLVTVARNDATAPNSTLPLFGAMFTAMSLVTVTAALSDFVPSARLVAVTVTVAGEGRSTGAVYTPLAEIVPTKALPPATPFALQFTA